jgi:hypothetical protein
MKGTCELRIEKWNKKLFMVLTSSFLVRCGEMLPLVAYSFDNSQFEIDN